MKCIHCNQEHPDNFMFCPITGAKLEPQKKACTNEECCDFGKYILPPEANFCPRCGHKIERQGSSGEEHISPPPIGKKFKLIKVINYDFSVEHNPSCGYCCIERDGKYGVIDANGDEVIACRYDDISQYGDGLFPVCKGEKWGCVNQRNNIIIPFIYDCIRGFCNGLTSAVKGDYWGIIDKSGKVIVDFKYEDIEYYPSGYIIGRKDGYIIILDKDGKTISKIPDHKYKFVIALQNGYFKAVSNTGLYGIINDKGQEIIPCKYNNMGNGNLISALLDRKWGIIDLDDNTLYPFKNEHDIIRYKNKMYVIENGNTNVYDYKYDNIKKKLDVNLYKSLNGISVSYIYQNDFIEANLFDRFDTTGLLNDSFETVLPFEYSLIYDLEYNNRFLVKKDDKYEIIEIV